MSTLTSIQIDDEIHTQVINIIASQLHIGEVSIEPSHDIISQLDGDILDIVQISYELEKFFEIKIPEDALACEDKPLSVGRIVSVVRTLIMDKPEEEQENLFQRFAKLLGITNEQVSTD